LFQRVEGLTPLYLAVAVGQVEVVKVLLKHIADLKAVQSESLLHAALTQDVPVAPGCKRDSAATLKCLLSAGLNANARSPEGTTPLYTATARNNTEAVQLLLEHGADSNLKNADGNFPLIIACDNGHGAIVELLLQHGADIRATVKIGGYLGVTALMLAAHSGHLDVAKLLLARGADVNAVDQGQHSALFFATAAASNRAAPVKLLLQHGADPRLRSKKGESLLLSAVLSGDAQCTQLLVNAGADVNARCGLALPSFNEFLESAGIKGVTVIMNHGAVTTVLTDGAQQPLPTAQRDVIANDMSKTVLMAADTLAVVKVLLAAGADVHLTTDLDNTCLHTAAACNYPAPVICLLIKAGVSLHAVNREGKTAAVVAHDKGNTLAAALLNRAAKDV
jgi:uncharacterized protein